MAIVLRHFAGVLRFAVLAELPRTAAEVPLWAVCVPYTHWKRVVRYDGRSFEDNYARSVPTLLRVLLPLRTMYLFFLFLWPWTAFVRGFAHKGAFTGAMLRPDLLMTHPLARYADQELAWARPDYAFAMFYAYHYDKTRAAYFRLDDKHTFMAACREYGFRVPDTFTVADAKARGGEVVVKEPENDLGYGVRLVDAATLEADDEELVIQARLKNHPDLLAALPEDAPLSSFRVITLRDPQGNITVSRTAVRIGMSGSAADNTAQGGIWSRVDLKTGQLCEGVMKKTFARWRDGKPIRYEIHPNTGKRFVGLRIPWFEEGQRMALDAHRRMAPAALSLGWDIGLCEGAPVLLEVNVWTACYDYDPQSDAFTPGCAAILAALRS